MDLSSLHKGAAIEMVCATMAIVSLIFAAVGAYAFSFVGPMPDFAMIEYTTQKRSAMLVVMWLASGVFSVAFWYVMSGIGRTLQCAAVVAPERDRGSPDL